MMSAIGSSMEAMMDFGAGQTDRSERDRPEKP
jgi:hypothetical protein